MCKIPAAVKQKGVKVYIYNMKLRVILISIAVCFVMLAVYSAVQQKSSVYSESKQSILLRKLAHELMLSAGDSVSRVLPVKQISEEEFHVFPENALAIMPDSFVNIVNRAIKAGDLTGSLTASILKYQQNETVYGFAASSLAKDNLVSCVGRELPKDRYYLSFVFSNKHSINEYAPFFYLGGALTILAAMFFGWRKRPKPVIEPVIETIDEKIEDSMEGLVKIGNYTFNPAQQSLELDGEKTVLTVKEAKLLSIFAAAPNIIIERDSIQKEVWENEGVIVTRSLDVFISKLRKKLAGDPAIRIVNVHGKGYKLEVV